MTGSIVATEFMGIAIILVIIYGAIFEVYNDSPKRRAFIALSISVLVSLAFDLLSYIPVNTKNFRFIYIITVLDLISPYIVNALFLNYVYISTSVRTNISRNTFMTGIHLAGLGILLTLGLAFLNKLFVITPEGYEPGELYVVYLSTFVIASIFSIILIIINFTQLGTRSSIAIASAYIAPAIALIITIIRPDADFVIPSMTISLMIINIMLQADREKKLVATQKATLKLAYQDALTGLPNRLAYVDRCNSLWGEEETGIIYCDLNGLKYTNDHYGHAEGNKLLRKFADLAKENFGDTNVHRVAGDEFIIFVQGFSQTFFAQKAQSFATILQAADEFPIASIGSSYGGCRELGQLVKEAELKMYKDKQNFYSNYPKFIR